MTRFKRILKRIALALGLLFLVYLIANAVLVWVTGSRLEGQLAEMCAKGEPVVFSDLGRPAPPPDQNAATFFERANSDLKAFSKDIDEIRSSPEYERFELSESNRKAMREAFDRYPQLLPLLRQAANCPEYQSNIDYSASPDSALASMLVDLSRMRSSVNALDARVRLAIADGKPNDAMDDAIEMLRLSRQFEKLPLMIGHLVAIACRGVSVNAANHALRSGPVSEKSRQALDRVLSEMDRPEGYLFSLRSELAFGIDSFRGLMANTWFTRAYFNDDESYEIDMVRKFVELSDKPFTDVKAFEVQFKENSGSIRHSLSQMTVPAMFKVREANDRSVALLRCLRIFNAIQSRDREPALTELGLPASALNDPFTGGLLHAKKTENGWIVYSVGANLTDDGGDFEHLKDVGVGPKTR